jgi:acetyltransferase-like isoleucine patch superfamily enzyme
MNAKYLKIIQNLLKLVNRVANKVRVRFSGYTLTSKDSIMAGYVLDSRSGHADERVSIGRDSVLSCRIVLERDIGTVSIGDETYIGSSTIICCENICIGNNVLISWGCTICDHDSHSLNWHDRADDVRRWRQGLLSDGLAGASKSKNWHVVQMRPIIISDKVWIGMNVTILKGVTVGEGSVIAAGSIVTKDIPAWSLAAGNPARVIRSLQHYS